MIEKPINEQKGKDRMLQFQKWTKKRNLKYTGDVSIFNINI